MGSMTDELFGSTLKKTEVWLTELGVELEWDHPAGLLAALRAALHALRDRLPPGEAAQLAAQLPLVVRGIFFEGWQPAAEPWKVRHEEDFLERVAHELRGYAELREPEWVMRSVFTILRRHISAGEIDDVIHALPAELRDLW